ncbi:hypothetical protein SISNIDRAFT_487993 [Sistotremastrum niveocremeum HHB9708]|uniref:Integrase core domain-containing protein n=1 Tax=Sistotremastrum niveocremeum HHB9708 TaxID=1314777 RepID=A0A164RXS4_9AGAM|nr:hypothetical protein SISNIDRAFT_487993 [Sistotremastrum niveocremeum HHB9708]
MPDQQTSFPDIPVSANPAVVEAYNLVRATWEHGETLLSQEDVDPVQLRTTATRLESYTELVDAMEEGGDDEEWIRSLSISLARMIGSLRGAARAMTTRRDKNTAHFPAVQVQRTGQRGRPAKVLDEGILRNMMASNRNVTMVELAKTLNVHPKTVKRYMQKYGITKSYSAITNAELDDLFRNYRKERPHSEQYGRPTRVRGDRGGENFLVAKEMVAIRGENKAAYIFGTSTHNTRIERLWREVGDQFARCWKGFFLRLQNSFMLDKKNPHHLWLLNHLFLKDVQESCTKFQREWNHHAISGRSASERSPADMRAKGVLIYGYPKEVDGDIFLSQNSTAMSKYFGKNIEDVSDSGSDSNDELDTDLDSEADSDSDDSQESEDEISEADRRLFAAFTAGQRHVPRIVFPFPELTMVQRFQAAFEAAEEENFIPNGYGMLPEEDEYEVWDPHETVTVARKDVTVTLLEEVWKPRAGFKGLEESVEYPAVPHVSDKHAHPLSVHGSPISIRVPFLTCPSHFQVPFSNVLEVLELSSARCLGSMWDHLEITKYSPSPPPRPLHFMKMPKVETKSCRVAIGGPNSSRDRIMNEANRNMRSVLESLKSILSTMNSPPTPSQEIAPLNSSTRTWVRTSLIVAISTTKNFANRDSTRDLVILPIPTYQELMVAYFQLQECASSPVRRSSVVANTPEKLSTRVPEEWVLGQRQKGSQMVPPTLESQGYDAVLSIRGKKVLTG